ncbi:MAG TPA: FAD-dependent oxidoreductase [Solirubrobacteraceae bacterium]|jgi:sulfide:quinone oxidoreductase
MRVLIAGGGVAGLEAALALRDLAGDKVDVLVLAPEETFEVRALSVRDPFGLPRAQRHALAEIGADAGFQLAHTGLASVEPERRIVHGDDGTQYDYDALIVAIGATPRASLPRTVTFTGPASAEAVAGVLQDMEEGYARRIAFVAPAGNTWPLPLYELALLTAERARSLNLDDVTITIVTPEETPLALFGPEASRAVAALLAEQDIDVLTETFVEPGAHGPALGVGPGQRRVGVDRVVSLPLLDGPRIPGLPADAAGFLPIDQHCRVLGIENVWAAGDGTTFPIKQGGIAAQQADAAAQDIAALAGASIEVRPFRPLLRGILMTASGPRWLRHAVSGGGGLSVLAEHALWWPPSKVAGHYLAPYLQTREEEPAPAPEGDDGVTVEVDLHAHPPGAPHGRRRAVLADADGPGGALELLAYDTPEGS